MLSALKHEEHGLRTLSAAADTRGQRLRERTEERRLRPATDQRLVSFNVRVLQHDAGEPFEDQGSSFSSTAPRKVASLFVELSLSHLERDINARTKHESAKRASLPRTLRRGEIRIWYDPR